MATRIILSSSGSGVTLYFHSHFPFPISIPIPLFLNICSFNRASLFSTLYKYRGPLWKVVSVSFVTSKLASRMLSKLLEWQPLTVLIFSMFFLGSFLSVFFFLKILFYGTRLTVINGLYALSFLTMGLVVPSYVRLTTSTAMFL